VVRTIPTEKLSYSNFKGAIRPGAAGAHHRRLSCRRHDRHHRASHSAMAIRAVRWVLNSIWSAIGRPASIKNGDPYIRRAGALLLRWIVLAVRLARGAIRFSSLGYSTEGSVPQSPQPRRSFSPIASARRVLSYGNAERIHTTRLSHPRNMSTLLCDKPGYPDGEPSFRRALHSRGRCAWKPSCPILTPKGRLKNKWKSSRSWTCHVIQIFVVLFPALPII
jgi:hypothetical protein